MKEKQISFNTIFNIVLLLLYLMICIILSINNFTNEKLIGYGTTVVVILIVIIVNVVFENNIEDNNFILGIAWKLVNELIIFSSIVLNGILILVANSIKTFLITACIIIATTVIWNFFLKITNDNFNVQDKDI